MELGYMHGTRVTHRTRVIHGTRGCEWNHRTHKEPETYRWSGATEGNRTYTQSWRTYMNFGDTHEQGNTRNWRTFVEPSMNDSHSP